jgi:hypothetical protein
MEKKICRVCKKSKLLSEFEIIKTYKLYRKNICKKCNYHRRNTPKRRIYQKEYLYNYKLKNKYGINKKQVENAIKKQGGKCPICKVKLTGDYHIDHSHKTGKFRGILCSYCNQALGQFKDNIESLENAIKYLKSNPY